MRQRIKQTLSREKKGKFFLRYKTNHKHLLHSGNGTYFYKLKLNYSNTIPLVGASLALLLVLGILICPIGINGRTYADEPAVVNTGDLSLVLDIEGEVNQQTPIVPGTPAFRSNTVKITADGFDNNTGYSLYVQAAGGTIASLVNSIDNSKTIKPLSQSVQGKDMPVNTWGYAFQAGPVQSESLNTLEYRAVSESGVVSDPAIDASTEVANQKIYTLAFGANIDKAMPSGSYTANVLVSLAAGANEVTQFQGLAGESSLQKFAANSACAKLTTPAVSNTNPPSGQLYDERDGKYYWVSKLADGKCWLTQNLDYGAGDYDPGVVIYNGAGFTDVEDESRYIISTDSSMTDYTRADMQSGKTYYNAHYLVGNYYSWDQATAGFGEQNETKGSICPNGWKLPAAGSTTSPAAGSYSRILSAYGVNSSGNGSNPVLAPLFFTLSGYVYTNGTSLTPERVSSEGRYWTASTTGGSYNFPAYLTLTATTGYAGGGDSGYSITALPVRCVTK